MIAHPGGQVRDIGVLPHPRGEALEGPLRVVAPMTVPDITVDRRRVRPVRLDSHDRETVRLDETARDGGAGLIKLGSTVARFAEQHDLALGKAVEEAPEIRVGEV